MEWRSWSLRSAVHADRYVHLKGRRRELRRRQTDYAGSLAIHDVKASPIGGRFRHIVEPPFLSADTDAAGDIYVVWPDCRFRKQGPGDCTQNDIVMSTSSDGRQWSDVVRIPIDARSSSADHFLAAIAIEPTTSGGSAHIAIVYYFYPDAECSAATCELDVGSISSSDGGVTWDLSSSPGRSAPRGSLRLRAATWLAIMSPCRSSTATPSSLRRRLRGSMCAR
jgi:hypothetical protein